MEVVVGRVAKAHGIRGELTVDPRTDSPEQRFAPEATVVSQLRDGTRRTLTVAAVRQHTGRLLVTFREVLTRDVAESLRGCLLLADTADLPPTGDPDEFYDHELEGLAVRLAEGDPIGTVREISHAPGADLLVLELAGGREALVPFVKEIVPEVDVTRGFVRIDPPEGLLDED